MRSMRRLVLAIAVFGTAALPTSADALIFYEVGAGFRQPELFDFKEDIVPQKIDFGEFSFGGALCPAPGTPNFLCASVLSEAGNNGGRLFLRSKARIKRTNADPMFGETAAYADTVIEITEMGGYVGTPPKVAFYFGLSGTLQKTTTSGAVTVQAFAQATLQAGTGGGVQCFGEIDCLPSSAPKKLVVTGWTPSQGFRVRLRSDVAAVAPFGTPGGWDAEVVADFADTLEILAIEVLDENDVPIPGVQLTALDGEGKPVVTFPNVPVPEPGGAAMAATGAVVLAGARRLGRLRHGSV